ncbi:hypothetical protein HN014_16450 [Aquimarina sp. TRL1]|uniref:hypothetical protein n=1 Tax=Aquimarina sp. (strain TRL1) TaxID=2736252 RepID=UPI00158E1BD8|nr:hypothetical protein [Aquimarina sp. TRL1]QKX06435.1 hypothetical protein HN014_16450 [Aquimarina sp. TRL1]
MKTLRKLVKDCDLIAVNKGKCPMLLKIATEYKNKYQIKHKHHRYRDKMCQKAGVLIADLFENAVHSPFDPMVQAAYTQLAEEVVSQFSFLKSKENIVFEPYTGEGEPYADSFEMLKDIHQHHLYFFTTSSGFGEDTLPESSIMLQKTGIYIDDYELVINDIFRIVHDIFGHAMEGYGFGPIGEDYAWFEHLKMFSPLAAAALTTETRGQNCWVNFGPHMRDAKGNLRSKEDPKWLAPNKRPFAEQKMALLPEYVSGIQITKENTEFKTSLFDFWDPCLSLKHDAWKQAYTTPI